MLVDETGTYRGYASDWGISTSSGGFPQFVVQLVVEEVWDFDEKVWVSLAGGEDAPAITAYLILFGKTNKPTFNVAQLKKAFGWNGASLFELSNGDYQGVKVQFRVEENTYNDNTSLQVNWIDEADATPGRSVNKLNDIDLKRLDAQYSQFLDKVVTPVKAATKPKPVTKPAVKPVTKPVNLMPKPAAKPVKPATKPAKISSCTEEKAWEVVCMTKKDGLSDDDLGNIWLDTITEVAGEVPDDKITPEQWAIIAEKCQDKTAIL